MRGSCPITSGDLNAAHSEKCATCSSTVRRSPQPAPPALAPATQFPGFPTSSISKSEKNPGPTLSKKAGLLACRRKGIFERHCRGKEGRHVCMRALWVSGLSMWVYDSVCCIVRHVTRLRTPPVDTPTPAPSAKANTAHSPHRPTPRGRYHTVEIRVVVVVV